MRVQKVQPHVTAPRREPVRRLRTRLHTFRLALRRPLVTAAASLRYRAGFLVTLDDGEHAGWGEATPLPGWSHHTVVQTSEALSRALSRIEAEGEDALEPVLRDLGDGCARAAVFGAWADLCARRAGRQLALHLLENHVGAAARDAVGPAVAVNALVTASDKSEVAEQAATAVRAGISTVKLKVGVVGPSQDIRRIRAARAALGTVPELRLDANGAWGRATAVEVLAAVEPCRIAWCEEPADSLEEMAAVQRATGVAVAADESILSVDDAAQALRLGIGVLILKPQALGGADRALDAAVRARGAGAAAVVTSLMDSAVGVAHALHTAAAVDALSRTHTATATDTLSSAQAAGAGTSRHRAHAHGLATSGLLADDTADPPTVENGLMRVPRTPGLGVVPTIVEPHRMQR